MKVASMLYKSLTHSSRKFGLFWLILSLTISAIYGYLGLKEAFASSYIIQDDARQHIFWMQRFVDSALFPDDLIANYFQSVAPSGYKTLYYFAASLGINPLIFNKILPSILGLITTGYCFGLCYQIIPLPAAGFMASLLLNQMLWTQDDLISGTPRAFLYPLLTGFLYYVLKRKLGGVVSAIALFGLFYPQGIFICIMVLILRLLNWHEKSCKFSQNSQDYLFCFVGLGVAAIVLLPYALVSSEFNPTITVERAKSLPEFWGKGRSSFFSDNFWKYFFESKRSGMLPRLKPAPTILYLGWLLPILLCFPKRFPLVQHITANLAILPQLLLASLTMFGAAHVLLFKLHLPNRYTSHSFRIILAIATALSLVLILDALFHFRQDRQKSPVRTLLFVGSTSLVISALLLFPLSIQGFPITYYQKGLQPSLYQFFKQQPKDILIASFSVEADFIPTFARRSVLMAREYAIPYHWGYYRKFRQRTLDLIQAQYSPDFNQIKQFINNYKIDFWVLDTGSLTLDYLKQNRWMQPFETTQAAIQNLQAGKSPILTKVRGNCQVFQNKKIFVLDTRCILKYPLS